MDYLENVKQRRAKKAQESKEQYELQKSVSATKQGAAQVSDTIKKEAEKSRKHTYKVETPKDLAKTNDINQVRDAVRALSKSNQFSSKEWDKVVSSLESTVTGVLSAVSKLNDTVNESSTRNVQIAVKELENVLQGVKDIKLQSDDGVKTALGEVKAAIEAIDVKPVVNVPAAEVTVNEKEVDFAPVIAELEKLGSTEEKIDLDDYRAQDLDEDDVFQRVGFVDLDGRWFIIENDMSSNTLRYAFGASDYPSAWGKRTGLNYKRINEAYASV